VVVALFEAVVESAVGIEMQERPDFVVVALYDAF